MSLLFCGVQVYLRFSSNFSSLGTSRAPERRLRGCQVMAGNRKNCRSTHLTPSRGRTQFQRTFFYDKLGVTTFWHEVFRRKTWRKNTSWIIRAVDNLQNDLLQYYHVVSNALRQRFSNFFQVGTTFISQNVLRTTLLLGLSNSLGLPLNSVRNRFLQQKIPLLLLRVEYVG